jgi:hypothetical protein
MGLLALFDNVKQNLADQGVTANVVFGRREPTKQINQGPGRANRVVFAPGDDSGSLGEYAAARDPGRNPRPLRSWDLRCRVFVWAYDGDAPQDEYAQFSALLDLHDAVIRAIYRDAVGQFQLSAPRLVADPVERRFGEEMVFELVLVRVPILDAPQPTTIPRDAQGPTLLELPNGAEPGC